MSTCRFIELSDGFRIEHPRWEPVTVRFERWAFVIESAAGSAARVGLAEHDKLARTIAERLAYSQLPSPETEGDTFDFLQRQETTRMIIRARAHDIAGGVRAQRRRLLAQADPTVLAVQRAVFAATNDHTRLTEHPALYREPYIVADVLRYRAAAIALGMELCRTCQVSEERSDALPARTFLDAMTQWRGLFSPTGRSYRSLDRTLMNLPGSIDALSVCDLHLVHLERPIVNPLELKALLWRLYNFSPAASSEAEKGQIRIFQLATESEIRRAMVRLGAYEGKPMHAENDRDVHRFVCVVKDLPERHRGRLGGLVEKAIGWERNPRHWEEEVLTEVGDLETPTARPPIPLPSFTGMKFLDTVCAVLEEGRRMRHCIASCAGSAVKGSSFLFHFDYRGQRASLEVASSGEVLEAAGPANHQNLATFWGTRVLRHWGASLKNSAAMLQAPPETGSDT